VLEVSARITRMLIKGMTASEIRVLQEYRRLQSDSIPLATIKAIKHPAGGGEAPAMSLVAKGYLSPAGDNFNLTPKAKEFLAYDPKPEFEEGGGSSEEAVE
jgi:hypothetical protein